MDQSQGKLQGGFPDMLGQRSARMHEAVHKLLCLGMCKMHAL